MEGERNDAWTHSGDACLLDGLRTLTLFSMLMVPPFALPPRRGHTAAVPRERGATMAATSLFALPLLVLFLFLQRTAVGGLTSGAVKG
uniref:ABC transporter permease n=1 Tax=Streptomyces auratus AGR0001 TaxID=1160718 RepID=J2A0P3_9ACTN